MYKEKIMNYNFIISTKIFKRIPNDFGDTIDTQEKKRRTVP